MNNVCLSACVEGLRLCCWWISVQEMGKGLQDVNKRLKVGVAGLTPAVKVESFIERKKLLNRVLWLHGVVKSKKTTLMMSS